MPLIFESISSTQLYGPLRQCRSETGLVLLFQSHLDLALLLIVQGSLSIKTERLELLMNQYHLCLSEGVSLPVYQILHHRQLLQQVVFCLESLSVDLVQVLSEQVVVQLWVVALWRTKVKYCAAHLEEVLVDVI